MASIASSPDFHAVYPVLARSLAAQSGNATNATTSASAPLTPFGSVALLDDTLLNVVAFLIVLTAAHPLGMLFPRFLKLPLITGYLLVGVATGPFVSNLLTTTATKLLASSINAMALSFISFQAGQEIYLPELKPQLKGILQLLVVLYGTTMALLTTVLTLGAGPFFYGSFDGACQLAIALLFGSIAVLGSPATVMAIKMEVQSVGPFTNLMLGATMMAEFVVLVSFSVSRVVSSVYCAKLDVSIGNLVFTLTIVMSNILVGALIALVIIAIFSIPSGQDGHDNDKDHGHDPSQDHSHHQGVSGSLYLKGFLWLFMGYVVYISTAVISEATIASFGHVWDVKFEPLLLLMTASCIAGHYAKIRHDMHVILDASAPFVFLPFFVMTGAALPLDQVANAIPLMSLFVGLRYLAIFLASYGAGRFILKLPPMQYNNLWLTMTPQAGVALGLANEVKSLSTDPWASEFAATIVAAVVVNQIVGPVLCAMGLDRAGESQVSGSTKKVDHVAVGLPIDGDDDDLEAGGVAVGGVNGSDPLMAVRQAVVVGDDDIAFELALQLVLNGATVAMPLLDDDLAVQWDAMQTHLRSADGQRGGGDPVRQQLAAVQTAAQQRGGGEADENPLLRTRGAIADGQTDLVVFTGDDQRALDSVRMLHTFGSRPPRLVAMLSTPALLEPLRSRGVVCLQSSVALANLALQVSLLNSADGAVTVASTESGTVCETPWRDGGLHVPAVGAGYSKLQRVLLHRRRVLKKNLQTTRHFHAMLYPSTAGKGGETNNAPQRVSMFGRASTVEFLSTRRGGGQSTQANFFVANDVYVMGGGDDGEGGFEEGPLDDTDILDPNSARSARPYMAGVGSPTKPDGQGKLLSKMMQKNETKVTRGNHWM